MQIIKNSFIGLLLLSLFSCNTTKELVAPSKFIEEEGFELKMLFQPNSQYVTHLEQDIKTSMSTPSLLKESSVSNVASLSSTLTFGPMIDDQCDMLTVFDKIDMKLFIEGEEEGVDQVNSSKLAGLKIYGKLKDGVQSIDSIVGEEESIQEMLEELMEPVFKNLKLNFPNPMKIGDEFLDTKVIEMPMGEMGSTITTETKYTLIKVSNNIAEFNTQINLNGKVSMMGKEIPIKGSGSGTMSLDIEQQYTTSSSSILDQVMTMEMQGMTMNQKTVISITTTTKKVK